MPQLLDRFMGCIVGQCLADALGAPVESQHPAICRHYVEEELQKGRAGERSVKSFPFGQYTDDSQLARELIESWVELGHFEPAHYARRIAALFGEKRIIGHDRPDAC